MNDDDSRKPSGLPGGADDDAPVSGRREPVFSDFDEDEDFEESDRDTDFASAYEEDELDDEDYPEPLAEDESPDDTDDWQPVTQSHEWGEEKSAEPGKNPWDVAPAPTPDKETASQTTPPPPPPLPDPEEDDFAPEDPDDDWDDDYDETDEDDQDYVEEPQETSQGWPIGLIVVGLVALVLLTAGGYGVIQQRSATQEEVRQLQAALATAASPAEVAASREALQSLEQRYAQQQASFDALLLENRRLEDTVAGLESQLAKQQAAVAQPVAPKPTAKPVAKPPPPAAKPAPPKPAAKPAVATSGSGDWFVNFSSYSQRSAAESWSRKLQPAAGRAVVAPVSSNGKTLYRVRIVGLNNRAQAEKVASQLQSAHGVSKLWVGEEK